MHPSDALPGKPITRRRFAKSTAMALGLGPVLSQAALPGSGSSTGSTHNRGAAHIRAPGDRAGLGIALVGLGSYATYQLAPALLETQHVHLAGIVTGTPEKASAWQEKHPQLKGHVYNYDDFDRIADDDAIDIVYVVLPNSMHAEFTIRAAQAGKHVICEKPMSVSTAEARAMIAACEAADKHLYIGYRLHYEPHNVEAMRIGQNGVYGVPTYVQTAFGFRIGDPTQWRLKKSLAGGGALMDVGIYAIQAARYVTGEEPIRVTAQEAKTDTAKFAEVDETITWQMTFPSGCVATCATSYATSMQRLYFAGNGGWVELRPAYGYSGIAGRTSAGPMEFPAVNQQARHMDAIGEAIAAGRNLHIDGYEGLRDMVVIEAIYKSIRTGAAVDVG
jgi:predicted dehydrogenase